MVTLREHVSRRKIADYSNKVGIIDSKKKLLISSFPVLWLLVMLSAIYLNI